MNEYKSTTTTLCRVGIFDVHPDRNIIINAKQEFSLEPRMMDVLCALIEAGGKVVTREALINKHWDTIYGADESLTRIISLLRKTIREAGETNVYIETIPKRGYRLVQPVSWLDQKVEGADGTHGPVHLPKQTDAEIDAGDVGYAERVVEIFRARKWALVSLGFAAIVLSATLWSQGFVSHSTTANAPQTDFTATGIAVAPLIDSNSIAVLPFIDLSAAGDQEYFSDGISEEILNVLARIDGLTVASRTSSFQFKGQGAIGIPAIAQQLRVRYILQGSVRKAGESIRITTQLIEANSDQHLWSSTFNRTLTTENIFAIQDEIANATVDALETRLNSTIGESPSIEVKTSSVDAYEAFLKARSLYQNRMEIHEAERLLLHSITLDPNFADAWALRSAVYIVVYAHGPSFGKDSQSDREQSRIFAQKALDMQPSNVLALASIAFADMLDLLEGRGEKTFADVIAAFNRALEVDPNSIDVLNWRGIQLMRAGYIDLAIADYARCVEIDRAAAPCRYNLMAGYAMNNQSEEAVRVLFEALDYGAFSQDTLVLLVLSEIERRDLFLFASGWNPQLRGWHRFGQLYDALQTPEKDHSILRAQLTDVFEKNGINTLAADMLLSSLGDTDAGAVGGVWWFDTHNGYRQTPTFKHLIRDIGIFDYWKSNGFPPQCQPIGETDFKCD